MGRRILRLGFCICLIAFGAAAEERVVDISAARALGNQLLQTGRAAEAAELARTLLARDAGDLGALLLLARATRAQGQFDEARAASAAAWEHAQSPNERYVAAMVRAQVLSSAGARTRAQLWLRRAAHIAPSPATRARAIRDFRYVRGRNPFSTYLRFSTTPNSNINNGSKSDTMVINGLPFLLSGDSRALSGFEFSTGLTSTYRVDLGPSSRLRFGISGETKSYALSSEARAQAPDQRGSDYAYSEVELRFGIDRAVASAPVVWSLDTALGQNWYAGDVLSQFGRLRLAREQRFEAGRALILSSEVEETWRQDNAARSSTAYTVHGTWRQPLGKLGLVSFGLGARDTQSEVDAIDHTAALGSIGITFAQPVMGARLSASLNLETRDYPGDVFAGSSRTDTKATFGLNLLFEDIDLYGFAPRVGLRYERNRSNIELYDTEGVGLTIGTQSVF